MRVIWSPAARADLDRIGLWLDEHRGLQISADTLELIHRRARFLEDFPHGGRPLKSGLRLLRVLGSSYLIAYRLTGERAEVARVRHEREDWLVEP